MTTTWDRLRRTGTYVSRSAAEINRQQLDALSSKSMVEVYAELRSYYSNDQYNVIYSGAGQPYPGTRGIYNPTKRVVDWYAHRMYPGPWAGDGLPLPDGTPAAVPFASDTEETVRLAAMAGLEWSNWDERRAYYPLLGSMYGDVAMKPYLDVDAGKVYLQLIEPEYVTDLEFNNRGDVIAYKIEIPRRLDDDAKTKYVYGEYVDKERMITYYDGSPFGYDGLPAEQPNPFGFCPFVWVRHTYVGGVHGAPAIDGVVRKIDELNHMVSSIHDYIGKMSRQPIGIASDKSMGKGRDGDGVFVINAETGDHEGRSVLGTMKGPADFRAFPLLQDMGLTPASQYCRDLISEIEKDLPETVMDQQLREMSQVAGIAIPRLMGDVANRYLHAQRSYDGGLITAMQMMISMGSFAIQNRLWRQPWSDTQKRFLPFNLNSYDNGDLAVSLMNRPLVELTAQERAELALLRSQIPAQPTALREAGYSEEAIYGEGNEPDVAIGIIAEREIQSATAGSLFGTALNRGIV
jgi:hypothetical protein